MDALAAAIAEFERHGPTDVAYLSLHFGRFAATKATFESTWTRGPCRVLDVGAHWLHQSYLYARDGYEVTAADVGEAFDSDAVKRLAKALRIRLLPCGDLSTGQALAPLHENSFDVILFTEIVEHLAFNPVALWRALHRVLAPAGRILVTTPNYRALRSTLRRWGGQGMRFRGGLPVADILRTPTYGHHWKEYTLGEVREYFSLLSPDFAVSKALYVEDYYRSPSAQARVARCIERVVPAIRPNLHVEIDLVGKAHGLPEPRWA